MLNGIVKLIIPYNIIYTSHFDRPDIKASIRKTNNFSVVTSICPK